MSIQSLEDTEQSPEQIEAEINDLATEAAELMKATDIKARFKEEMQYKVVRDVWGAILHDGWMWGTCWSEPRKGKSTCLLRLGNTVYHDWDLTLACVGFNIGQIIWKMDNNLPMRMWEISNHLHYRIPYLIYDDAGAGDNKASSQHQPYFDLIKGNWDVYATKVACIWNSLNQPNELTLQLASKYTHELMVIEKGVAKYDRVKWGQNFYGWQPNQNKKWKQTFEFDKVPIDVYRQYDEMRMSLVDELNQRVKDKMAETEIGRLTKVMMPADWDLLSLFQQNGALTEYDLKKKFNVETEVLKRVKSRNLAFSNYAKVGHYKVDLSALGSEILRQHQIEAMDPKKLKQEIHTNDPNN